MKNEATGLILPPLPPTFRSIQEVAVWRENLLRVGNESVEGRIGNADKALLAYRERGGQ